MIEISFNHRLEGDTLLVDKLTIGHGLPRHGQLDFITFITEEYDKSGEVVFATHRWGFGLWMVKRFINRHKGRKKS